MKRSTREILNRPYARILVPDNDGTYTAEILEFPGCYGEGDTAEEALKDLEQAAASWIEAAIKQGQEIPEPLDAYGYSGRINLRLPKSIHKQAARFAERERVSLNQYFTDAIAARGGAEDLCERLFQRLDNQPRFVVSITQVEHNSLNFTTVQGPLMEQRREGTERVVTQGFPALTVDPTKASSNG